MAQDDPKMAPKMGQGKPKRLQGRSKNMAMLEVAKVRAAQLAKKGQQCVDLAGELASWNSKYQCLEDRFELKERELRVAGERAKEGRWQSKINFAMSSGPNLGQSGPSWGPTEVSLNYDWSTFD